ncbi:MAG: hypothetical protein ACI9YH_000998 [Colwellia sp.]|jgi:hypothetical protein
MIKTLKSPYQWRHKMTDKTGISQGDEAKLINVLVLGHGFKIASCAILIFHPDNLAAFAVKQDENADYQQFASLDELIVSEYEPEVYQSIFYGLLTLCYCMKLSNAPQIIAFAEIFEDQMIDLNVDDKKTDYIAEINRLSHYLIRKIKRKPSIDNADWTLASKPISYEIKTRAYLMNKLTTLEK